MQTFCRHLNSNGLFTLLLAFIFDNVSPLEGAEDILLSPWVRPSVCLSVTKLCPLYNFKIVRDISAKLPHPVDMSCKRTITLLWIFLELFPFDHLQCYFVSAL